MAAWIDISPEDVSLGGRWLCVDTGVTVSQMPHSGIVAVVPPGVVLERAAGDAVLRYIKKQIEYFKNEYGN